MSRTTVKILVLAGVLLATVPLLALCAGCGQAAPTTYTLDSVNSSKLTPTQSVNLRTIENASMAYWGETDKYPTNIKQLVPTYMKKIPTDEKGGVYFLQTSNGKPVAAVKF